MITKVCYVLFIAAIVLIYLIFDTRKCIYNLLGHIGQLMFQVVAAKKNVEEFKSDLEKETNKVITRLGIFLRLAVFLVLMASYLLLVQN